MPGELSDLCRQAHGGRGVHNVLAHEQDERARTAASRKPHETYLLPSQRVRHRCRGGGHELSSSLSPGWGGEDGGGSCEHGACPCRRLPRRPASVAGGVSGPLPSWSLGAAAARALMPPPAPVWARGAPDPVGGWHAPAVPPPPTRAAHSRRLLPWRRRASRNTSARYTVIFLWGLLLLTFPGVYLQQGCPRPPPPSLFFFLFLPGTCLDSGDCHPLQGPLIQPRGGGGGGSLLWLGCSLALPGVLAA